MLHHLASHDPKPLIYQTCQEGNSIPQTKNLPLLPDWTQADGIPFLKALVALFPEGGSIQLCGLYRELCLVSVAHLILKHTNLEPIIVANDDYSISATYSVAEGETLAVRIAECGGILQEV